MTPRGGYEAVVLGASAGGLRALRTILGCLPAAFKWPLMIVQHVPADTDLSWLSILEMSCVVRILEAVEKESALPGSAYFAPPNYHLLMEPDRTFALSVDEKVNYSRPAIDVLFESAADVYGRGLIGIVLTGANRDGAAGLLAVKQKGGLTIVQQPESAEATSMPEAAIRSTDPDFILSPTEIGDLLVRLHEGRPGQVRSPVVRELP